MAGPGKPKGITIKRLLRMEMAIRLQLLNVGFTDQQIADQVGMRLSAYRVMKNHPEFRRMQMEMASGVFAAIDKKIYDGVDQMEFQKIRLINSGVPLALQNLLDAATQKNDKKLQLEASKEILDRTGVFGKVSRIESTVEQKNPISKEDESVANQLNAALSSVKAKKDEFDLGTSDSKGTNSIN